MNRYFYLSMFLIVFICFIGISGGASVPALNKPEQNWKIVELKGFVNTANGECELWTPGQGFTPIGWDGDDTVWVDFGCDADYERFRKYQNSYVYCRCYEVSRGFRSDATAWNRSYIYIDCREVVAK